jgi:hypothetical protein
VSFSKATRSDPDLVPLGGKIPPAPGRPPEWLLASRACVTTTSGTMTLPSSLAMPRDAAPHRTMATIDNSSHVAARAPDGEARRGASKR